MALATAPARPPAALSLDQVKAVYRAAIPGDAPDWFGAAWWEEVACELQAVVAAPCVSAAGDMIAWWHNDWTAVGDSPRKAALRLRRAAARVRHVMPQFPSIAL